MATRDDHTQTLRLFDSSDVKLDAEQKLHLIKARLRAALLKRTARCKDEAEGLRYDMTVCAERLDEVGFEADISSVKVAGYHIAQTELLVLRRVWKMVNSIIGGRDYVVDEESEEEG